MPASIFTILASLTDANLATILESFADNGLLLPFLSLLPTADKKRIVKMGTKYEGYVNLVDQAAVSFPDTIPAANPYNEFKSRIVLFDQLTQISNASGSFHQLIEDTRTKLGSEILATANVYYSSFKRSSKNNTAMAEILADIASFYGKKPAAKPVIYTIATSGTLAIKNVLTGRQLVNKGSGVVSIKPGLELAYLSGEAALVVDPSSSEKVPKGWTSIIITNLSASQIATISVRMK